MVNDPSSTLSVESFRIVRPGLGNNPSLARTGNGDLLLLYANYADCMEGCRQFLLRSTDNGVTWSEPEMEMVSSLPKGGVEGTVSCLGDLSLIFYLEGSDIKRHPTNEKYMRMMRSTDHGRTWSEPETVEGEWGEGMPFGHAIRLRKSGRILLPAWGFDGWLERSSSGSRIYMLASDDDGVSWRLHGTMRADASVKELQITETSILELPDGRILAMGRGDAHKSGAFPYSFRSISDDGGATWEPARPVNINFCEPRLLLFNDKPLLVARSWPGNFHSWYRPLEPQEREPGSNQTETVSAEFRDEFLSPVRDFGVVLFSTEDDGVTWTPELTMQNPKDEAVPEDADALTQHRYQAAYPGVAALDEDRLLVVFRQPDPTMPDLFPGLTYSHVFQRFLAANVIRAGKD